MMVWRWFLVLAFVLLAGCGDKPPTPQSASRLMMGTLTTLTLWSEAGQSSGQAAAMQAAFEEMARVEVVMSSHRDNSLVGKINQAPRGVWLPVDEELALVVAEGLRIQALSDGAFDVGLWPLSRLWGFSQEPPPQAPPAEQALQEWRSRYVDQGVQLRGPVGAREILLANEAVGLDLGAIAKGYAVDKAMDRLVQLGYANAIVNGGGNLAVSGGKGTGPWRIGIQHPRQDNGVAAEVTPAGRVALVTSGDYERFFMVGDKRYHHILNPRLGIPAESGVISVTIRHPSAMVADALSTATFVLGVEKGMELVRREAGAEALFILANGQHQASGGFQFRWLGL